MAQAKYIQPQVNLFLKKYSINCQQKQDNKRVIIQFNINSDQQIKIEQNFQDLPYIFTSVLLNIKELQEIRIIQYMARPIQLQIKQKIMKGINQKLQKIYQQMFYIKKQCSKFNNNKQKVIIVRNSIKNRKQNILHEQKISLRTFKQGVRKIQLKLTKFYKQKLAHFSKVNKQMKLGLKLYKINYHQWFKECMKKTSATFCWC